MPAVLLVDDEDFFRERLAKAFTQRGFTVFAAANYDEAMQAIADHRPELAVVDLKMPGKSGLDLVEEAKNQLPGLKIVVLTGYGSIATAIEAVRLGALSYLSKPADVDDILRAFTKDPELKRELALQEFSPPSLARVEWEHINRVLADCGNNITMAAKKLGLHRRTLQRKLFKYAPRE